MRGGAQGRGAWLPPVGNSSGGAAGSGLAVARVGGTRVRTVAGGAGSLMSEAQLAAGGHGGERHIVLVGRLGKEMEWAEPI
jgi:hypothetical protein